MGTCVMVYTWIKFHLFFQAQKAVAVKPPCLLLLLNQGPKKARVCRALLKKAYENYGMQAEADQIDQKIKKMVVPSGHPKRVLRPRKVVI